jgi:uncharacterized membrane protein HdeD (DUF308 family)
MVAVGVVVLLIGFALITPRGSTPGSVAHRIVRFNNLSGPFTTPGYEQRSIPSWRATLLRILIGLALIAAGLAIMAHWWPADA